ncbi:MAG TPA: acyl-CoA dehydrogenase [Gammaproteobacteria bacterium]|jgi:alkylation response protein AidB-like acyl-CoA dehydrogenase|nr:acyl-CoA dehydrogenase [Gammaproteobacteria bacterium]
MNEQHSFRAEVKQWIAENFPRTLAGQNPATVGYAPALEADHELWRQRLAEKGWGAPTWPKEYGGAGFSQKEERIITDELSDANAFNPIPTIALMGVTMVGPTILDYGTEEQKKKHLIPIARGEVTWCLGLSEPGAGSDLASLRTRAEDNGDYYLVNGSKIWTSGAHHSNWCGAVVRTDPDAKKRNGISFVMLPMDQEGVEPRPLKLISGASAFCETFFTDAVADKSDLLGELNDGWSVVKRLLQHERQSQIGARTAGAKSERVQDIAERYVGLDDSGKLADADLRQRLANHLMDRQSHALTLGRIAAEAKGNVEVSAASSILKNSATHVSQTRADLILEIMGDQGLGWEGDAFDPNELETVRSWLYGMAASIAGGSFEIQYNIISKNILGLPETTQQG